MLFRSLAPFMGVLFYISVHYRLQRFNKGGHSDAFEGYPSPGGASLVAILIGSEFLNSPIVLVLLVSFVSFIMVSTLKYPHNRVADKKIGFKFLRNPTLMYWFLTIAYFFGVPFPSQFLIPEVLMFLNMFYVMAPIIPERKPHYS